MCRCRLSGCRSSYTRILINSHGVIDIRPDCIQSNAARQHNICTSRISHYTCSGVLRTARPSAKGLSCWNGKSISRCYNRTCRGISFTANICARCCRTACAASIICNAIERNPVTIEVVIIYVVVPNTEFSSRTGRLTTQVSSFPRTCCSVADFHRGH